MRRPRGALGRLTVCGSGFFILSPLLKPSSVDSLEHVPFDIGAIGVKISSRNSRELDASGMATNQPLIHMAANLITPRCLPLLPDGSRIRLHRWTRAVGKEPFVDIVCDEIDGHLLSYSFAKTDGHVSFGRRVLFSGPQAPGVLSLIGPLSERRNVLFRESVDIFRVYIPNRYLLEFLEENFDQSMPCSSIEFFDAHLSSDAVLRHLVHSLAGVDDDGGPLGPCFVDSVGLAISFHMFSRYGGRKFLSSNVRQSKLPDWRLKRVQDYIESNLATSIRLHDLSAAAGLSRTHFATQFRATVGCPPHAYILRRRIARAQRLLMQSELSTADVALAVGFRTHSHFTAVFRRIVGETPTRWRTSFDRIPGVVHPL
jgi:AraC family transcriptional regulator